VMYGVERADHLIRQWIIPLALNKMLLHSRFKYAVACVIWALHNWIVCRHFWPVILEKRIKNMWAEWSESPLLPQIQLIYPCIYRKILTPWWLDRGPAIPAARRVQILTMNQHSWWPIMFGMK
jgi:hypothetical protein